MLARWAKRLGVESEHAITTGFWLATEPDVKDEKNGQYWDRKQARITPVHVHEAEALSHLWNKWEQAAGLKWPNAISDAPDRH